MVRIRNLVVAVIIVATAFQQFRAEAYAEVIVHTTVHPDIRLNKSAPGMVTTTISLPGFDPEIGKITNLQVSIIMNDLYTHQASYKPMWCADPFKDPDMDYMKFDAGYYVEWNVQRPDRTYAFSVWQVTPEREQTAFLEAWGRPYVCGYGTDDICKNPRIPLYVYTSGIWFEGINCDTATGKCLPIPRHAYHFDYKRLKRVFDVPGTEIKFRLYMTAFEKTFKVPGCSYAIEGYGGWEFECSGQTHCVNANIKTIVRYTYTPYPSKPATNLAPIYPLVVD